jgi:hypothetical protein
MPTLNEVPEVAALLATILTGEPVIHGALAVIPLLAPNLDDPDWLTLEDAGDRAHVTEVSEAGSVPFLQVAKSYRSDVGSFAFHGQEGGTWPGP